MYRARSTTQETKVVIDVIDLPMYLNWTNSIYGNEQNNFYVSKGAKCDEIKGFMLKKVIGKYGNEGDVAPKSNHDRLCINACRCLLNHLLYLFAVPIHIPRPY